MGWGQKTHPLEGIIVTISIAIFAGGIGTAAWMTLGQATGAAAAAVAAAFIGWAIMERADGGRVAASPPFAPIDVEEPGELLLTRIWSAADEELLLDDPLPQPSEKSRVVSLFAPSAVNSTPGELVDRIGDYLGQRQGAPSLSGRPVQPAPDASAELYAALANIRASLR